ncbi:hypothetical protein [Pseudoglutamicibacter albus]|uniref:Very-short-patch-repair endonuclease n=1 Tax=Pseudoglutamicibacter albus TaxID=98671 RepID=A0ABU1Z1Z6_9MICC|nr:hypothetical protein [Pseudoglutamicibacter albus]MDR7294647.1 very-short-patch-repair endonuclease [Pseudoglutamicibacter albus]
MGRKLTPPPEALHNTVFTRQEAIQAGLTPGQLRSHQYTRVAPSIYCHRNTTPTPTAIARAYSRSRPRIVITGIQAAQHYKLPLPHWIENPTTDPNTPTPRISLWSRTWRRDHPGHHLEWNKRRLKPGDVTTLPDPEFPTHIHITTVERTWFDLANILDLENMVITLDHIIRIPNPKYENREKPLSTPAKIAAFIDAHPHIPGIRIARKALRLARIGADSPQETRLRLACREAQLPEPAVNRWIQDHDGHPIVRPDLTWPEAKVACEYDGAIHTTAKKQVTDARRNALTARLGWQQIIATENDMSPQERLGWLTRERLTAWSQLSKNKQRPMRPLGVRIGHYGIKLRVWQPASMGLAPALAQSPVIRQIRKALGYTLAA